MNCKEVKVKLPEYLAGVLDNSSTDEMKKHIESCKSCTRDVDELNTKLPKVENLRNVDFEKILKKTKWKFNLRIIQVIIAVFAITIFIYMIPVLLQGLWSFNIPKASRIVMDIIEFSQPNKVNSWGSGEVNRLSLSVPLTNSTLPQIGKKYREQREFKGKMSVITGKVAAPSFFGANFVHPDIFKNVDFGRDQNPKIQKIILQKNAETSVATVDFSLNKIISLKEVAALLSKYDFEVCWMAVETGTEGITFSNMTFENQQVLQWGIPGKLTRPGSFDYEVLNKSNYVDFEKAVKSELQWLYDNRNIVYFDNPNLKYVNKIKGNLNGKKEIKGSMEDVVQYILKNGIKIYGFRATGPSDELLKLSNELNLRTMNVVDMDFWNW